jgi:ABC-2 type transport system permease protein
MRAAPAPTLDRADQTPALNYARPGAARFRLLDLTAIWSLYVLTLRQHLHGKRWMVVAVLFLLPAGLALLIRSTAARDVPGIGLEFIFVFMFFPQGLLPLVALIYASGIIQDEQEEQTITYLLIRPIPKWALYVVKLLATLTTTVILTAIFTALTYATIYAGADTSGQNVSLRCAKAIGIHSLAVVAYCCVFGLMGLLTRRTLIVGILYIAIFEGLLANVPLSIRLITVVYYARLIAYRALSFVITTPYGKNDLAANAWQLNIDLDPQLLDHPTKTACFATLLIGSLACTILAAWLCTRKEFHVKTPEKG